MRIRGYLYASATVAVLGAALVWSLRSEDVTAVTHLSSIDGHRFATAVPSRHDALAPCVACHRVEAAGPERSAPALAGIVGAPVAAASWFGYSPALARKEGVWSRDALDTYLADPIGAVPGTFKTLSPIRDEARRREILDALERL